MMNHCGGGEQTGSIVFRPGRGGPSPRRKRKGELGRLPNSEENGPALTCPPKKGVDGHAEKKGSLSLRRMRKERRDEPHIAAGEKIRMVT